MWLIPTGKTMIRDGKTYFATRYTEDVMDRKRGNPGPWFEKKETIDMINERNPMSADNTCFFNDDSIAFDGCKMRDTTISGRTEISGDIEIKSCLFSGLTLNASERHDPTTKRIISETTIETHKNHDESNTEISYLKAMVFIHSESSICIERSKLYQTDSQMPYSSKKALICVFDGGLIIKDSFIESNGGGIYCDQTCLKVYDSKILENSKIELRDGEDSKILNSTVDAHLMGSGFYIDESHIEGKFTVFNDAKGLTFIKSKVENFPKINVEKMGMYFNNTTISGTPSITLSGLKCYDVSFESCTISDNAKIESCGVELCFETFSRTTFGDDCYVKDAQTISSNICGRAFVYGVILNTCNVSGNAIVGAELDKTPLPYSLASKINLSKKNIRNFYDLYIIKVVENFYFGFMDYEVYGINKNFVFNKVDFSEVQDSVEAGVMACQDFPLRHLSGKDYDMAYQRLVINSISKSISLLKKEFQRNLKVTSIVRNLVYCSIMRIFTLFSWYSDKVENVDYSSLNSFKQYIAQHASVNISKKEITGLSKDFTVIPSIINKIPEPLSFFFDKNKKIDGVVI